MFLSILSVNFARIKLVIEKLRVSILNFCYRSFPQISYSCIEILGLLQASYSPPQPPPTAPPPYSPLPPLQPYYSPPTALLQPSYSPPTAPLQPPYSPPTTPLQPPYSFPAAPCSQSFWLFCFCWWNFLNSFRRRGNLCFSWHLNICAPLCCEYICVKNTKLSASRFKIFNSKKDGWVHWSWSLKGHWCYCRKTFEVHQ